MRLCQILPHAVPISSWSASFYMPIIAGWTSIGNSERVRGPSWPFRGWSLPGLSNEARQNMTRHAFDAQFGTELLINVPKWSNPKLFDAARWLLACLHWRGWRFFGRVQHSAHPANQDPSKIYGLITSSTQWQSDSLGFSILRKVWERFQMRLWGSAEYPNSQKPMD